MNNYSGSQAGSQQSPGSASKVGSAFVEFIYLPVTPVDEIILQTRGTNTLRPVTIKQILEAVQPHPDAEFKIDDVELSHVDHPSSSRFQFFGLI